MAAAPAGRAGGVAPAEVADGDATRFAALLEHAPILLFELDPDGVYTVCAGSALAGLGIVPGKAVGLSFFEVHATRPEITSAVRSALAGEQKRQLVSIAGRVLDATYTPILAEDGSVARVIGVANDVTELHERTQALAESEARLRDFVEASSDWLWKTDEEHRFVKVTERFGEILGTDPKRVIGRRRAELRNGDPADGDWEAHERALAERRPFRDFVYGLVDGRGRRRVVTSSGIPVHGPDGRFRGYRGTARDITRRVEAEERLKESEARFRSLVTNMRDIIFCHGAAGGGRHGYDDGGAILYGADVEALAGTRGPDGRALIDLWYASSTPTTGTLRGGRAPAQGAARTLRDRVPDPPPAGPASRAGCARSPGSSTTRVRPHLLRQLHPRHHAAQAHRAGAARQPGALPAADRGGAGRDPDLPRGPLPLRQPEGAPPAGRRRAGGHARQAPARPRGGHEPQRLQERLAELRDAAVAGIPSRPRRSAAAPRRAVGHGRGEHGRDLRRRGAAVQVVLIDVTARKRAEAGIRHMAHHDALTGLPNRSCCWTGWPTRSAPPPGAAAGGADGPRPRRLQGR
jgi:PAS domain S-box-containing protein